jgi:prepilin-type N-terminal cleavage/methylation domain-containing protein
MKKRKEKKGFTLTELLAIIVIISIIASIAIVSIKKTKEKTLEISYQNVKSTIEVAAEKYASNTNIFKTNVDTLIKTGYLPADDEKENVYDPRNGNSLNCYIVNIDINDDNYIATMEDHPTTNSDNTCNTESIISSTAIEVNCVNTQNCLVNDWYYGKISLTVNLNTLIGNNPNINDYTYTWTNLNGLKYVSDSNTYVIDNDNKVINTKYSVIVTPKDGNNKQKYIATKTIKIDNENPVVLNKDNEIITSGYTSASLNVTATDGIGSGIQGYSFNMLNNSIDCNNVTYNNNSTYNVTSNGNYYYCVKDNVGNIISSKAINISNIDNIGPTVYVDNIVTASDKSNVTFYIRIKDNEGGSGTNAYYLSTTSDTPSLNDAKWQTITDNTQFSIVFTSNGNYYIYGKDKANNIGNSMHTYISSLDTTPPYLTSGDIKSNCNNGISFEVISPLTFNETINFDTAMCGWTNSYYDTPTTWVNCNDFNALKSKLIFYDTYYYITFKVEDTSGNIGYSTLSTPVYCPSDSGYDGGGDSGGTTTSVDTICNSGNRYYSQKRNQYVCYSYSFDGGYIDPNCPSTTRQGPNNACCDAGYVYNWLDASSFTPWLQYECIKSENPPVCPSGYSNISSDYGTCTN